MPYSTQLTLQLGEANPVPHEVADMVAYHIGSIARYNEQTEKWYQMDLRHGGAGRYESEVHEKLIKSVDQALEYFKKFRAIAPKNGVNPEAYLESQGLQEPRQLTKNALEWLK